MQCKRFGARLVFLIIGLAAVACWFGCGQQPLSSTALPASSEVVLKVACPGGLAADLVREQGFAVLPEHATLSLLPYDLATAPPPADVWVIEAAELPHWASAGKLTPVPETLTARSGEYRWDDLLQLYRGKLLLWGSTTACGLPLLGESPLCFYRTDLLNDSSNREAFRQQTGAELEPPATWEEYAGIAEFFRDRKAAGFEKASLPPLPADAQALDRAFYQVATPYVRRAAGEGKNSDENDLFSFHYDLKTGQPRLAEAGFVAALQMQQRLQACRPAGMVADPVAAFAAGKAVLCLADAPAVARFRRSAVRGKFGVCRVPGSAAVIDAKSGERKAVPGGNHVAYLGAATWLAVVPTAAEHAELAWQMLAGLTEPKSSRQTVMNPARGGGAYRTDHLGKLDYWGGFGLDPKQTLHMVQALRQSLQPSAQENPVVRLRLPDQRAHLETLGDELRKALFEGKDAREALTAAAARWRQLDEPRGRAHRADCYRSLALDPPL